jgi:hypothetical protein
MLGCEAGTGDESMRLVDTGALDGKTGNLLA